MAYLMTYQRQRFLDSLPDEASRAEQIAAWQGRDTAVTAALKHASSEPDPRGRLTVYKGSGLAGASIATCDHANTGAVLCPECAAEAGLVDVANPDTPTIATARGEHNPMATPTIRPVPDSIEEGRKIRAAKAAGTYTPTHPHDLPSVVAHRAAIIQRDITEHKVATLEAAARMKDYVIPDSLAEGRKARDERNARMRGNQ